MQEYYQMNNDKELDKVKRKQIMSMMLDDYYKLLTYT